MRVGDHDVVLPTLPEALRIKAFLCLERNATRDYLDLAALAAHMGIEAAGESLWRMDELYQQKSGGGWVVRTQLMMQLAAPPPYDLDGVELAEYKGVQPPFDRWGYVAEVCGTLSDWLLGSCERTLSVDPSVAARQESMNIGEWRATRTSGQPIAPVKLPGLET